MNSLHTKLSNVRCSRRAHNLWNPLTECKMCKFKFNNMTLPDLIGSCQGSSTSTSCIYDLAGNPVWKLRSDCQTPSALGLRPPTGRPRDGTAAANGHSDDLWYVALERTEFSLSGCAHHDLCSTWSPSAAFAPSEAHHAMIYSINLNVEYTDLGLALDQGLGLPSLAGDTEASVLTACQAKPIMIDVQLEVRVLPSLRVITVWYIASTWT